MNTMTQKVAGTESSPRRSLKRVAAAAAVGNFVEWFDSAAYAVMSVTIVRALRDRVQVAGGEPLVAKRGQQRRVLPRSSRAISRPTAIIL